MGARQLFRYPVIEAARIAASNIWMSDDEIHSIGAAHIEWILTKLDYGIYNRSGTRHFFPQFRANFHDIGKWWVAVQVRMYPDEPVMPKLLVTKLYGMARETGAVLMHALVMPVNTRSMNNSLPSMNGNFTPLFDGLREITGKTLRRMV